MKKTINYTSRYKINHQDIILNVSNNGDDYLHFTIDIKLQNYNFPKDSIIKVEPYYKMHTMVFNLGSVGDFVKSGPYRLDFLPTTDIVWFRVKVVDKSNEKGKLLGLAKGVRPINKEKNNDNRVPILPVNYSTDLGQRIWNLSLENDSPILELNYYYPEIKNKKFHNNYLFPLVYPAVIKELLLQMNYRYEFNRENEWIDNWFKFIKKNLRINNETDPDNPDSNLPWIDDVVETFCSKNNILKSVAYQKF